MCDHIWEEINRTHYFDYWGYKVIVIYFSCSKCGRTKKRKFWQKNSLTTYCVGGFLLPIFRKDGERVSKLTAKQQAWVEYYKQGKTAAEAARLAGYKARDDNGFQSIGSENLRKLAVYIAERDKILETPRIADMEEINAFWTNVMRDKGEETKDRLKASELRAKAAGAFVQKIEHSGTLEVAIPLSGLTTEELRKLADDG